MGRTTGEKKPRGRLKPALAVGCQRSAPGRGGDHVFGLQAFITVHDRELHALAFDQDPVTLAANGAKVHEDIIAGITRDKAEALGRC
jgi:hypothetical protein